MNKLKQIVSGVDLCVADGEWCTQRMRCSAHNSYTMMIRRTNVDVDAVLMRFMMIIYTALIQLK